MSKKVTETGIVVRRKVKKAKTKNPVVLNATKAEGIMCSADGAEGTDSQWSVETKLTWIEKFQRKGVGHDGEFAKIYIHFDGVDTADVDSGEIIPRPK
jgi:hypothetical protein